MNAIKKTIERRCVLGRETKDAALMVRLVLGPDGTVIADLKENLPGRGAWITPDRALLEDALKKGKLRGALARAFETEIGKEQLGAAFLDQLKTNLHRRCRDRLGQALRSGDLVVSLEKLRGALAEGTKPGLFLLASDAGGDGKKRIAAIREDETPLIDWFDRDMLSGALGRDNAVYAMVAEGQNAELIWREGQKYRMIAFGGETDSVTDS